MAGAWRATGLDEAERARLFRFLADKARRRAASSSRRRGSRTSSCARRASRRPPARRMCSRDDPYERLLHTYGKSYPETVRAFARDFANAPDFVALPRDRSGHRRRARLGERRRGSPSSPSACGSSVVGGVEPEVGDALRGRGQPRPAAARPRARGRRDQPRRAHPGRHPGPAIEAALKPHGLAIRHYPQSFEFSTLGGWIATRSGGHFATLYTHIDDFVESLRTVTPAGVMESRRLPGSGAGPSPDRLMIGSEGALGVITEAWMRLQARPRFRGGAVFGFPDLFAAARAVRAVAQAGLYPSNLRVHRQRRGRRLRRQRLRARACSMLGLRIRRPSRRRLDGARGRAGRRTMAAGGTPTRRGACAGAPPSSACPMRAS